MRIILVLAASLLAAPAVAQDAEQQAVLAVVDRYLEAINTNDIDAYAELQVDSGMTFAQIYDGGEGPRLRPRSNAEWVSMMEGDTATYLEQYWDPTVLIHRDIAVFWAPYSFDRNGERMHCGVDVFDLVRVDGEWKVGNAMWTIEPDGCPAGR